MGKVIANILLFVLAIGLTIFTATRTLDLLTQWLPANQPIMAYLGLAAFEGGTYFWSFYFVKGAKGAIQRGIAVLMVFICFLAVAVGTVMDMLLIGAESGKLPELPVNQKMTLVVFVSVVIVTNVAAFLAVKLTNPDMLRAYAIQDAEDSIYIAELSAIRHVAPQVAAQMAPVKTQQWVDQTWSALLPGTAQPTRMIDSTARYVPRELTNEEFQDLRNQPQQMSMAQTATPAARPAISHKSRAQSTEKGEVWNEMPLPLKEGIFSRIKNTFSPSQAPSNEHDIMDLANCTCDVCQERRAREQITKNNAAFDAQQELEKGGQARQPRPFHQSDDADPYGADTATRAKSNKFAANRSRRRRANRTGA